MRGFVRFTYFATHDEPSLYVMAQIIDTETQQVQYTFATFDPNDKPSDQDIEWCSTREVHSVSDVEEAREFLDHCTGLQVIEISRANGK